MSLSRLISTTLLFSTSHFCEADADSAIEKQPDINLRLSITPFILFTPNRNLW